MAACCLVQVSRPPRHDRKGDQQNHDSGCIARVRPDEADDCPHDEHGDRCREPVEDPTRCDALILVPSRSPANPGAEPQLDASFAGVGHRRARARQPSIGPVFGNVPRSADVRSCWGGVDSTAMPGARSASDLFDVDA